MVCMVIIDKRKDYYDYLQGVIGQDPKAVYDRRGSFCFNKENTPVYMSQNLPSQVKGYMGAIRLLTGNVLFRLYFENFGKGLVVEPIIAHRIKRTTKVPLRLNFEISEWKENPFPYVWANRQHTTESCKKHIIGHETLWVDKEKRNIENDIFEKKILFDNPILATLPIRLASAEDIFLNLQEFILSQNDKPIVDNRTDRQKLEAAGFDNKTSFRKM